MAKKTKTVDRHKGKMFGVRLPETISDLVREMAVKESRPFSNMISVLIREALESRANGAR